MPDFLSSIIKDDVIEYFRAFFLCFFSRIERADKDAHISIWYSHGHFSAAPSGFWLFVFTHNNAAIGKCFNIIYIINFVHGFSLLIKKPTYIATFHAEKSFETTHVFPLPCEAGSPT